MGLFGKKKKIISPELDIPPAPPPVMVTKEVAAAPARAPKPSKPEFPTLPEIPAPPKKELPTFEEELKREEKLPPVKEAIEEEVPPPPGIEAIPPPAVGEMPWLKVPERPGMPKVAEAPPEAPSFEAVEEEVSEEEKVEMAMPPKGPIFIRADNYKYVLDELNVARNIAKESAEVFAGIDDLSSSSEQEYEHWRLCLEDVERKMLYVDKSLFGKG